MHVFRFLTAKFKSSELFSRIASGAVWSILGSASAKFLVLVAGILCANILGSKEYGELGLIRSTVNMFVVFGTAGMGITATKFISQFRDTDNENVSRIYIVTCLFTTISAIFVAALVLFLSPILAEDALHAPHLTSSIRFASLLLLVTILNSSYQGTLAGYENFKRITINTFISSTLEAVLVIIGALIGGINGALLGYGIGVAALTLLNFIYARKTLATNAVRVDYGNLRLSDFRILTSFSIPAALSSFLVVPSYWVVKTLIARYSGFEELGLYEASDQWRIIILFIPSALSNIVLPILSSYIGKEDERTFKGALKINVVLNVGVSLVMAAGVIILSKWILQTYGPGFDTPSVLIYLALSTVFSSFASVVGMAIVSQGKTWIGLAFNMIWSLNFILFSYISLTHGAGATGVAFSLMIAYMLHGLFQFIYLWLSVLRNKE